MRASLPASVLVALLILQPLSSFSMKRNEKGHDFIPKVHNLIFLMDVSDSMMGGYPVNFDHTRLYVAKRAFFRFNMAMPHVSRWQYDLNTAVITFGDCNQPKLQGVLSPWTRAKYRPMFASLRREGYGPWRTATFQDALQLAGSLMSKAPGRTAIVVFTDGGSVGEGPQKTAAALKERFGDKVRLYGIFFGDREVGWRNLYESCKLTGGYPRAWEEVRTRSQMKDFSWDILGREIMFPYPEIFFKYESAELLPSEALKLESVANFMHAIPQYVLQIDGHTTFLGTARENYTLGLKRTRNVKSALVKMYNVDARRILIRSWGEELPAYDNQNPEVRMRNRRANLYLMLPLRNFPYDEKKLHTHGVSAVGDVYITQERDRDTEYAWPAKAPPGSRKPPVGRAR